MERQQNNYLLSWTHQNEGIKTMEELRNSLLHTTMELEQTRIIAQEELNSRDNQIMHLRDLLEKAIKEKDEAEERYQMLLIDNKFLLQNQIEKDHDLIRPVKDSNFNTFPLSDGEESIVSSFDSPIELAFPERVLPEKGKLLKAVLKAGPLLQTLLLAGELPQWRHPPPQLESFEIPPVIIASTTPVSSIGVNRCGNNLNRKRVHCNESDSDSDSKRETKFKKLPCLIP